MDLRDLPPKLPPSERIAERRKRVEQEVNVNLDRLTLTGNQIGSADEKNCEQMIGAVPVPVGIAGPLKFTMSDGTAVEVLLPLATTEGALVASVNRGCKAITISGNGKTESTLIGVTRSLAFKTDDPESLKKNLEAQSQEWKEIGEATSAHLKILKFEIDIDVPYLFLTIFADTDDAMGMNMVTIAGEAIGNWVSGHLEAEFVTVAGNVDSDKKPSLRTYDRGRGIEGIARVVLPHSVIAQVLKTTPEAMLAAADAKLIHGSALVQALGSNLHAANMIAAVYLATGQDAAHVVEGSMADTLVEKVDDGLSVTCRLPALMLGVRGGGTDLPAQKQCIDLLLKTRSSLHPRLQMAETIAAAVLAGEVSLLAAQASHTLGKAHQKLGRTSK